MTDFPTESIVFEDDHILVTRHTDNRVAVHTGKIPEQETPTVVNASALAFKLLSYVAADQKS